MKFMIFISIFIPFYAHATFEYNTRGNLRAKFLNYTSNQEKNYGINSRGLIEQTTKMNSNLEALNQAYFESNSLAFDLQTKSNASKKDVFKTNLGENYLKFKYQSFALIAGYQYISWGEAFGINYADIINPKDNRITNFNESSDAKIPLFLLNTKYLFTLEDLTGSLQFIYSPEPKYNTTLPLDLFLEDKFTQENYHIEKEKAQSLFKEKEIGGKFAISYKGLDASVFYFNYYDRSPYYQLTAIDLKNLYLKESHQKIKSNGISFAKSIYDFVLRLDYVINKNKKFNYINNSSLDVFVANESNQVVSLDSPTYQDYSFILVFANSTIDHHTPNSFKERDEQYLIGKIQKNLGNDKNFELSYAREIINSGNTLQTSLFWPINNHNDLKLGGEFYFGNNSSTLTKLKKISNVFFSITNYFQL